MYTKRRPEGDWSTRESETTDQTRETESSVVASSISSIERLIGAENSASARRRSLFSLLGENTRQASWLRLSAGACPTIALLLLLFRQLAPPSPRLARARLLPSSMYSSRII